VGGFREDLGKKGENGVFDVSGKDGFGVFFDTRRRRKAESRPEYRRVRKYFKSSGKYWGERSRRKRVLELSESLTCGEIAERLGVSERTVKRDLARIRPYYERQVRSDLWRLQQERNAESEARLEGKSPLEQLRILREIARERRRRAQSRDYLRHHMVVAVDLDSVVNGFPAVKFWPARSTVGWALPLTVSFEFLKDKETKPVGSLTIQKKRPDSIFGSKV
jgi:transposase